MVTSSTHGVLKKKFAVFVKPSRLWWTGLHGWANLNALVGIAQPGQFGPDVMHFNLHKTCIPHGGAALEWAPLASVLTGTYLPNHSIIKVAENRTDGAVSAAPKASILPISWMYIHDGTELICAPPPRSPFSTQTTWQNDSVGLIQSSIVAAMVAWHMMYFGHQTPQEQLWNLWGRHRERLMDYGSHLPCPGLRWNLNDWTHGERIQRGWIDSVKRCWKFVRSSPSRGGFGHGRQPVG